jgi:hypothetical protein
MASLNAQEDYSLLANDATFIGSLLPTFGSKRKFLRELVSFSEKRLRFWDCWL